MMQSCAPVCHSSPSDKPQACRHRAHIAAYYWAIADTSQFVLAIPVRQLLVLSDILLDHLCLPVKEMKMA